MSTSLDLISVGRISLDFYANESNVGFKDVKTFSMSIGGSPTNVAIAAAKLGNKSAIITNIGRDSFTDYILGKLKVFNVDTSYVGIDESQFSPAVFAAMDDPYNPTIFFNRPQNAPDTKILANQVSEQVIKSAKVFWVSACALATGETAKSIKGWLLARNLQGQTVLDLDYRPTFWQSESMARTVTMKAIESSNILVGNRKEFEVATGLTDPDQISKKFLGKQVSLVIVKLGENGVYIANKETNLVVKPIKVDVRCGLGAGDAFGGMLVHGLIRSWDIEKIGNYANASGAIVASRLLCSDAMPSFDEVQDLVSGVLS
jgi:5-dehydro-2-deoxygluconokinase